MTGHAAEAAAQMPIVDADGQKLDFDDRAKSVMPGLLRYFCRRVDSREDAADCLSETMLVLWRKRGDSPEDEEQFRSWAYSIAARMLANHRRAGLRRTALQERCGALLIGHAQVHETADNDTVSALHALKSKDRELVMLIVWDGFGVAEAGSLIGLSATAARSRYSRARKTLQTRLARSSDG